MAPKIVIGFGNKTPLASPDHEQAMHITDAAVFYSRLTKWDDYFDGIPPHTITTQLYFRLMFEPSALAGQENQFTVDISTTLDRKLASIECYKTQFPPAKRNIFERVRAIAITAGSAAGFSAGEVFANVRPMGITDLFNTVIHGGQKTIE